MLNLFCPFCAQDGITARAAYFAPQSLDRGKTISWTTPCKDHAAYWNEGGDWQAPLVPIRKENSSSFRGGVIYTLTRYPSAIHAEVD
jgi:hypothetical protein